MEAVMGKTNSNDGVQGSSSMSACSYDDLFPALPESSTPILNNVPSRSMRVGSSVVSQVFHVPCEERKLSDSEKFGEGESLRACQQIMKETGAHIEISNCKDQSLTFLVKGKPSEVLEARRKILVHFQTQGTKTISIPKEHHGIILGKKGDRLKDLEKQTATKINVPNINEDSDLITITGTKEGIEKAEHEIKTMSDEQLKKAIERISIPKKYHPFILGPYGENLNKLIEETGAKINIPPTTVERDEIIITGEKDGVLAAKQKIEEIYKDMEKKCSTVSVEVSKAQHRYVIGQRGSTIQEILQKTGVAVEMPPSDKNTDTITLRGPQAALGHALTAVYEKANSAKSVTIDVPSWIRKYIFGKRNNQIKEFEQEFPNVSNFNLDGKVRLEGPPESVNRAQIYVENIVKDYLNNYTSISMTVNPNYYKHIIGRSGANVNRLKEELNVTVNIEENENKIRIEGPKESVAQAQQELQEKLDKLENEKTKDVIIDRRWYKDIIGTKGEKIRELKERYKRVLIMIPGPHDNNDIVKLRGPKDDVDKCHRDLMKIVREMEDSSYSLELPMSKQFHKLIIGKGGSNIRKICEETQTRIQFSAEGDSKEVINITGKKEHVLEAKERIQKIRNETSDYAKEEINIPSKFHNSIIGPGGKLISSIIEECGGVSINFPKDTHSDKVTIFGNKEDVQKAKAQLLELANERQQSYFSTEVHAKPQHHRFLIGKNGASIKRIRDSTETRICFPTNEDENKEIITIFGKKENVMSAKEQLEKILHEIDNVVEAEMIVPIKYHKHFVAKRYDIINRISEDCGGVNISFPKLGVESDRVILKGAKDCIDAAKQRIQEVIDDFDSQVTIELIIPQKHHRNIMGARGSRIQKITSDHGVQIKIPGRDATDEVELLNGNEEAVRQCDIIRITGRQEKCEAAKQEILDILPITEEISVPFDLHGSIIGQKGCKIRELVTSYNVTIDLPPPDLKLDAIKIIGDRNNIANAKEAIFKLVEDLETERKDRELRSYELKIDVDPEYHPKIIGRRGAVVNKLREDFGVMIAFPRREDSDSRTITITGYETKVHEAKNEIMRIVNELNEMVREVLDIDQRVHSRLIGQRGRNIRKIMEDFKVDVQFPRQNAENLNSVTIIGSEEAVLNAKDHIMNLAEEYLQDVVESAPSNTNDFSSVIEQAFNKSGFVVEGAPWERRGGRGNGGNGNIQAPNTQSQEDFPDFVLSNNVNTGTQMSSSPWGQRR